MTSAARMPHPPGAIVSLCSLAARLGLGGLLAFSGLMKLGIWTIFGLIEPMTPRDFAASIEGFKFGIPGSLVVALAFIVPWTELLLGLALLTGFWTRAAGLVAAGLMLAFIAAIASAQSRGLALDCTCFGALKLFCTGPLGTCHMVRNGVLGGLGLWLLVAGGGYLTLDRACSSRPLPR